MQARVRAGEARRTRARTTGGLGLGKRWVYRLVERPSKDRGKEVRPDWCVMLRVSRVTDRSGSYYLTDLATELGPLGTVSPDAGSPGQWVGQAAAPLGLEGPVRPDALAAVLSGRQPVSGRLLPGRQAAVAAYDLTFAAPKSVSILFALSGPETAAVVLGAHKSATTGALDYLERRALAVRRSFQGEYELIGADGAIGAAFTHGVSRALDPHLHTHVLVANLAHGVDGRWSAVDGRGLHAHQAAAGRLYDAQLRRALTDQLGVGWTPRGTGWDVAGIEPEVIGAFSSRHAEMRQYMSEHGGKSARARHVAWAATRDPKAAGVTAAQLARHWRAMASGLGIGPEDLETTLDRRGVDRQGADRQGADRQVLDEYRFSAELNTTPHTTVTRREVVAAWSASLQEGQRVPAIEASVDRLVPVPGRGSELGVGERTHGLSGIVARPHLLLALGPRPATPEAHRRWDVAAAEIDGYRTRWGVDSPTVALGVDAIPGSLQQLPAGRLADHLTVSRRISETLRQLGRNDGHALDRGDQSLGR